MIQTTDQEELKEAPPEEEYDHIAYRDSDLVAMCGYVFKTPVGSGNHDQWSPEDPYARCACGREVCPQCIELALVFDQLDPEAG